MERPLPPHDTRARHGKSLFRPFPQTLDGIYSVAHRRQRGAISVMSAGALIVMIGCCGMALEFSQIYNRRVELYGVAKVTAIAAARSLDGTEKGIDNALEEAEKAVAALRYKYGNERFAWDDSAVTFADSPNSQTWVSASVAKSSPRNKYFLRVSTAGLGSQANAYTPVLLPVINSTFSSVDLAHVAVAGRTSIEVMPMAICAMSTTPGASRTNTGSSGTSVELVEYGFRRGISYDLMRLNPGGSSPENYVIDPYLGPGVVSASSHTAAGLVRPFVCTGRMWVPGLLGGTIKVAKPFPLSELYEQINSRFDQYNGAAADRCNPRGAPPDVNIKPFVFGPGIKWMKTVPAVQSPPDSGETNVLRTMADLPEFPAGQTAEAYGPLWIFAKAVPFSAYTAGRSEPASGYSTFGTSNWSSLYKPSPVAGTYPGPSPYMATSGDTVERPSIERRAYAQRGRRILNIPLLSCTTSPAGSGQGEVLAIGRFLMTVPATAMTLHAEFGGIVPQERIVGTVELFK